jgi:TRAP-type C4-dicarboxylate transport system substrate-binding protein
MTNVRTTALIVAFALAAPACYYAVSLFTSHAEAEQQTFAFLMAHKPDNDENVALIEAFADRVHERTAGAVTIVPVVPSYPNLPNGDPADVMKNALEDVNGGDAFMAQISVKRFNQLYPGLEPLDALDAPGVFKDHEHAARVLDGAVGQDLLDIVRANSEGHLHGLGFTYSGGYRNIFSTTPIASLAELSGQTMRHLGSSLSDGVMEGLGIEMNADVKYATADWEESLAGGDITLEEAENLRIETYRHRFPAVTDAIKTVVETNHSMYLTLLVTNAGQFDALTPEHQAILAEEAQKLAIAERALSVQQAEEIKAHFTGEGVTFLTLTEAEEAVLAGVAASVRAAHPHLTEWMDRIMATE